MKPVIKIFSAALISVLFSVLLLSSCDENSPEPVDEENDSKDSTENPGTGGSSDEPYFYIHSGANTNRIQWFIITNGLGEIVGYKEIDPVNAEETVMSERLAEIKGNINIYHIYISETAQQGRTSYYINAHLDQKPGEHRDLGGGYSQLPTDYERIDINIYNLPDPFLPQFSTGGNFHSTTKIDKNTDGINDTVKLDYTFDPLQSEYILGIYNPGSPKYTIVESQKPFQEFTYPDDFHSYDHEIEVHVSDPDQVTVFGIRNDQLSVFLLLTRALGEPGWTHNSITLPYLDGYDSYYTYYRTGLKTYIRSGSIPSAESVVIPDRIISVTNSNLYDFQANYPAEIDSRRSVYSLTENENTPDGDFFEIAVAAHKDAVTSFDLILPDEFIAAHRSINFSSLEYKGTEFTDTNVINANGLSGEAITESEEYKYFVPK